jgi:hypothetical protein
MESFQWRGKVEYINPQEENFSSPLNSNMIVSGPNRRQWLDPAPILKPTEATNTLPEAITTYVNAVYYPNYRVYRDQPPASLNYAAISHVIYAFARYHN